MARKILNIGNAHDGAGANLHNAINELNDMLEELYALADNPHPSSIHFEGLTASFRLEERSGEMCLDQTITATGWSGTEGVDWDNIWSNKLP
jgi:hypothetical protein